jgi:hypothetical protein
VIRWYREEPYTAAQLAFCHPEWSATVWDRSAYRANKTMLEYPRAAELAVRSDALVLTQHLPLKEPDTGQPGDWRYKDHIAGPFTTPATADEMQALRHTLAHEVTHQYN